MPRDSRFVRCGQPTNLPTHSETGAGLAALSQCTPLPNPSRTADAPVAAAATGGVDPTGIVLPALSQAQPSALTIRNRTNPVPARNLTPSPESAPSVLDSGVTKISPRPEAKRSGTHSVEPRRSGTQAVEPRPLPAPATVPNRDAEPPKPAPRPIMPKLLVLRGERLSATYPIYEGKNIVGRFADKPVDIDLEGQESVDRIRVSRHHAIIHFDAVKNEIRIEDLNSLNGTWVNNVKIHSGQQRRLTANDVVQVGTVQLKLLIEQPE